MLSVILCNALERKSPDLRAVFECCMAGGRPNKAVGRPRLSVGLGRSVGRSFVRALLVCFRSMGVSFSTKKEGKGWK